jgi:hypothetical protein
MCFWPGLKFLISQQSEGQTSRVELAPRFDAAKQTA